MTKEEQVLDILKVHREIFIDKPLAVDGEKIPAEAREILVDFFNAYKEELYSVIDVESHDVMYTGTKSKCLEYLSSHETIWSEFIIKKVDLSDRC